MSRAGAGRKRAEEPPPAPRGSRTRWVAVFVATVLATIGFWTIVVAIDSGEGPGWVTAGVALLLLAFLALAAISASPRPFRRAGVGIAAGGAIFVALVGTTLLFGTVISFAAAIVMSLGVGGAYALNDHGREVIGPRLWSVVLVTTATFVLLIFDESIGVLAATLFPFAGVALADNVAERPQA